MPKYDCDMGHPLDMIVEECGEIIQAVMKHRRFEGTSAYYNPRTGKSAMEHIHQEIADLLVCINIAVERSVLNRNVIDSYEDTKRERLYELFGYEAGK